MDVDKTLDAEGVVIGYGGVMLALNPPVEFPGTMGKPDDTVGYVVVNVGWDEVVELKYTDEIVGSEGSLVVTSDVTVVDETTDDDDVDGVPGQEKQFIS